MVGQGSPETSYPHGLALRIFIRFGLSCAVALMLWSHASSTFADEFRLRLSWGGSTRQWHGDLWLSEGTLEAPQPLGVEADEPGSMWLESGHLIVHQRSPRVYDAMDLLVRAPRNAKLFVQLAAKGDSPSERKIEAPLEEILGNGFSANLESHGCRLRIERQPGDLLPIQLDSPSMVFASGDTCSFLLDTTRLNVGPSEKIRFIAQLKDPSIEKAVWQSEVKPIWQSEQTVTGDQKSLRWDVPLNVAEGIYQLTIMATQPGWLPLPQAVDSPLVGARSHATRMLELIVLDSQRPNIATGRFDDLKLLKLVEEIDPTHPEWWKRFTTLPQVPRFKRLWNGPLGNNRSEVVDDPLGSLIRLYPNKGSDDRSWETYMIPIKEPGKPHLLELRYPSNRLQTFAVSIVEPNEFGANQSANLDTGVDQFEEIVSANAESTWLQHRVVFWPQSKTPIVRITNLRDNESAFYGPIRVSRVISDHLPRAYPPGGPSPARLFAAYLDRPLFPESFSAEKVFSPPSPLGMTDWKTFYQGGTRLTEYLNHVGYGGLILSVYADGSTIYPSQLLQPTTRYDTGAFLASGQDPVRKDVLEVLLRLFDREGLKLIPALEFATPLPAIEAVLRQGGPESEGMLWIGRDGRSWPEVHGSSQGRAPYYNVLHPRVQEAMLDVLRELVERYSHHPSFAGVAIQLSADGYAQLPARLPNSVWGLDDHTVGKFEKATGLDIPAEGPNRFDERYQALVAPKVEAQWLDWRAKELAGFYGRAHKQLTGERPGTRLYLAGARMFEGEAMRKQLRPTLPRRLTLDRTMMQVGINPRHFSDPEGPVLLYGETVLPWTSLASQSVPLELESMRKAENLGADDYRATGVLFYHQPQETLLGSFDRLSPFQPSETRLTTQAAPSASQNRRRFVRALAHFDPVVTVDGSLRMPLGQEDSLRDLVALYRRLPASRFETLKPEDSSEPLSVRYLRQADATYLVIANEAGFPVSARVRLRTPSGCRLEELTGIRQVAPLLADSQGHYWDIQLGAYDAIGAWLSSPRVAVIKASARWSPEIDRALKVRVDDLVNRRSALTRPREWGNLENSGFEAKVLKAGEIPGWVFHPENVANVQLDMTQHHQGSVSLRLVSTGKRSSIVSLPFKSPKTGRLAVTMWLRSSGPGTNLPLQIGIFGDHHGRAFHRPFSVVGKINDDWSPVSINVHDVPVEGLRDLRLQIQMTGLGQVWIDDVQLEDLHFDPQEQLSLIKTVHPARETLADGQVLQCIRILESYWPRFLLEHVPPMDDSRPAVAQLPPQPAPPSDEKPADSKEPGFLGRIRDLVPDRLRF